jgi:hypothetical protein
VFKSPPRNQSIHNELRDPIGELDKVFRQQFYFLNKSANISASNDCALKTWDLQAGRWVRRCQT